MRRAKDDGATLVVHSDHGFKWGSDRTCARSSFNWSTAAYWHRMNGVFAAWGARVRPSKGRAKVSIFDVTPTVLALMDLPADRRMTGRPVAAAFAGLAPLPKKDLFGTVVVRRVSAESLSTEEATEYAKKLRALGYLTGGESQPVAPAGGDRPGMTEGGWNNLGVYLREETHDLAAAAKALQKSLELRTDYAFRGQLADPLPNESEDEGAGVALPVARRATPSRRRTIADWVTRTRKGEAAGGP